MVLSLGALGVLGLASSPAVGEIIPGAPFGDRQTTTRTSPFSATLSSDERSPTAPVEAAGSSGAVDLREFGWRMRQDLRAMTAAPLRWDRRDWGKAWLGLLAIGAASAFDGRVRNDLGEDSTVSRSRAARAVRPLGQEGGVALLGLGWAAGRAFDAPGLTATSQDGLEAVILSAGIVAPIIKLAAGRARPSQGQNERSFDAFSGDRSFPSGESTEAFAIAAVVAGHSRNRWVQGLAWSLASAVALERLQLDGHWSSDVVAGALLGAGVGHWVVKRHRVASSEPRAQIDVGPSIGRGRAGFGVRIAW